ncbi:MAG: hypothetical protein A2034_05175 [Elusimicrobia bacterium GWA2_38_7]|nr:MAG: hypothetical protein A2034_05175 [Elusimicrobia bacterium GWA2_38_7]
MITSIEKIIFLRQVQFFQHILRDQLSHIASISEEIQIQQGTTIFKAGDEGDALYLIMQGEVRVVAPDGRTIAVLIAPECFGEMAILDEDKRSATIIAETNCAFLKITRDDFRELILEQPAIAFELFQVLTTRLRQAIGQPVVPTLTESHEPR